MKTLKSIVLAVVILIAALSLFLVFRSPSIHMERSIVIQAPAERIFPYLNSARMFQSWSPFSEIDTLAAYSFEGPSKGVGSKMSWVGNKDIGKGSQWIVQSEPYKMVKNGLAFEGMDGTHTASFILTPEGSGTKLSWTFDCDASNLPFTGKMCTKIFGLFAGSMIGPTYEKGLNTLKKTVEKTPEKPDATAPPLP